MPLALTEDQELLAKTAADFVAGRSPLSRVRALRDADDPLAFSPVCSHQLPAIERDLPRFTALDAVVMGVSVDSHYANTAFADRLRLSVPLLSDFRRETSSAYGVLLESGHSARAVFVIDKQGWIIFKEIATSPGDPSQIPDHADILAALQGKD